MSHAAWFGLVGTCVLLFVAALVAVSAVWPYRAARLGLPLAMGPNYERHMVEMRDGNRLFTEAFVPRDGKFPVVLVRGYSTGSISDAKAFNEAGYAYVGQATRGHGASEGDGGITHRLIADAQDGYDTLTWISEQPWSNGKVAMYGSSYWGATQWLVAPEGHPNLKAIVPKVINADLWQCSYWCNGALTLAMTASGRAYEERHRHAITKMGWRAFFSHLPLTTLDQLAGNTADSDSSKLWKTYLQHPSFDAYWQNISIRADGADGKYEKVDIPVYLMGGWYDYYTGAAFNSYQRLRAAHPKNDIRIAINPGDHLNRIVGDREFGADAQQDEVGLAIRWLDHVVKGLKNGVEHEPPIRIFVMGANEWRYESEWPPARTEFRKYYLRSANGSRIGGLTIDPPTVEPPSPYVYDPQNPVPTLGGNHSFVDPSIEDVIRAGAVDQRPNASREDVLVFTSDLMREDMEVTGPIALQLYASSSARDTDFTAKLIDVYPDGTAFNLTEGILRTRFRNSLWEAPKLMQPGEVYLFRLDLQSTSNVFKKGHRIEVHITSSNFPLWSRNQNTGNSPESDVVGVKATQTVYHDAARPSHILLPVLGANALIQPVMEKSAPNARSQPPETAALPNRTDSLPAPPRHKCCPS